MEQYFNTIFEDVRHKRSLKLLLSLTDPDLFRQRKFVDHEIEIIKNIALENLHRHLKEFIASELLEKQFLD